MSLPEYESIKRFITSPRIITVKSVKFSDKIIKKNSIFVLGSSLGPVFQVFCEIIIDANDKHIFIKKLNDCYYDAKLSAFKIYSLDDYTWERVCEDEIHVSYLTNMVLLSDGYNYIYIKIGFKINVHS